MSSNVSPAADTRRKLIVVLGSSLTIMGSITITPVYSRLLQVFAAGEDGALLLQLAITAPTLSIALLAPFGGWLSDRIGRKALLMAATLCYGVLGVAPVLTDSMSTFVLLRILFGATEAVIMTCCMTLIADYWQDQQRRQVLAWQVIAIGLTGTGFYALGGALGELHWSAPFYLYALPLLLLPLMQAWLNEPAQVSTPAPGRADDDAGASAQVDGDHAPCTRKRALTILAAYAAIFLSMVMSFVLHVQMPTLLAGIGIDSPLLIGLASGTSLLCTLLGALAWPSLHRAWGTQVGNLLVFALYAIALALLADAQAYAIVIAAAVIHGVASGLAPPNMIAAVMDALTPRQRGIGMGLFTSVLYLGQFSSPLLVAWVGLRTTELRGSVLLMAVISLAYGLGWMVAAYRVNARPLARQ